MVIRLLPRVIWTRLRQLNFENLVWLELVLLFIHEKLLVSFYPLARGRESIILGSCGHPLKWTVYRFADN